MTGRHSRRSALMLLAAVFVSACSTGGTRTPGPGSRSPSPAAMPAAKALDALGEQIFPRHPVYGYYVSCVNFPENGAWAPPPQPPDYSVCPITERLRGRMLRERADFVVTQTPWPNRSVASYPRPGGGLVVVSLGPYLKVEMVAVADGSRVLVDEVVAKGEPPSSRPPLVFQEKPSPLPGATSAGGPSRLLPVPWYHQAYELSCEEAALRMGLAYEGVHVTEDQIFAVIPNDTRPPAFNADGSFTWGDAYQAFVGARDGSQISFTGYGTYYPTIEQAAQALGGKVLRAAEGVAAADVYAAILAGHPVVAWVTYQWLAARRQDYTAFDGRRIPYAGPVEHAVTVVGVQPDRILINNPWSGPEWIRKADFESSFATYDRMAVILS